MAIQRTMLLLDSTELFGGETYATIRGRLQTANAAKVSYTPTHTELSLPAGDPDVADLRLVDCLIPDSERNSSNPAGDLTAIHSDNVDTAFFHTELSNNDSIPIIAPEMLAYTGRRAHRVIRHQQTGGYGSGTGKTFRDAFNGLQDTTINGGTDDHLQPGVTYWLAGEQWGQYDDASIDGLVVIDGNAVDDYANSTTIRGDYPGHSSLWIGAAWSTTGQQLPWENYDGNVYVMGDYSVAWSDYSDTTMDWLRGSSEFNYAVVTGNDTTLGTHDLINQAIVERVNTVDECVDQSSTYIILDNDAFSSPNFDQVWQYDLSEDSYVDETTDASSADTSDYQIFPSGLAAAGDICYFGSTNIFSGFLYRRGTAGAGTYTISWQYWNGTAWTSVGTTADNTDNFKSGTLHTTFWFNPKSDWALLSVNGSAGLYYIRGVLQSGTITTEPLGTFCRSRRGAMFVHLHDGSDPGTKRLIPGNNLTREQELQLVTGSGDTRIGRVELINLTTINHRNTSRWLTATASKDLPLTYKFKGGRHLWTGRSWFHFGGQTELFMGESHTGCIEWDTSDRPDPEKDEAILAAYTPGNSIVEAAPAGTWDTIGRFVELGYVPNGLYFNSSGGAITGERPDVCNINGYYIHNVGRIYRGLDNNTGQNDMHSLAMRGSKVSTSQWTWQKVYSWIGAAHIVIYQSATGEEAAPINGTSAEFTNFKFTDFICNNHIDMDDTEPNRGAGSVGLEITGDNDQTLYDDGAGSYANVLIKRGVIIELDPQTTSGSLWSSPVVPTTGQAVTNSRDIPGPTPTDIQIIRCNKGIRSDRARIGFALYAVREDNGTSFTDVTQDLIAGTETALFPATPATNDAFYVGYKRATYGIWETNLVTLGVGTPGLAFEYWDGSSWTAVSNLNDASSGFTVASNIEWDRDGDWVAHDESGNLPTTAYWMRARITSGTFSTVPTADDARGPAVGFWMRPRRYYFDGINDYWFATRSGTWDDDQHVIDFAEFKGKLKSGETIAAKNMFRFGSSGGEETLSTFKARSKGVVTTDALAVSDFLSDISTTPGVDIEEI